MRPKGWENPYLVTEPESFVDVTDAHFKQIANGKHTAFEAGADAYEEGLKKEYGLYVSDIRDKGKRGWIIHVFIEE